MKGKSLTGSQRTRLLQTYLNEDTEARRVLEKRYSITSGVVSWLAREAGHYKRPVMGQVKKDRAAMWERAIRNGKVVA